MIHEKKTFLKKSRDTVHFRLLFILFGISIQIVCSIHIDGKGDTEEFRSRFRDVENRLQNTGYQVRIQMEKMKVFSHLNEVRP
jgi:hypothetical protein